MSEQSKQAQLHEAMLHRYLEKATDLAAKKGKQNAETLKLVIEKSNKIKESNDEANNLLKENNEQAMHKADEMLRHLNELRHHFRHFVDDYEFVDDEYEQLAERTRAHFSPELKPNPNPFDDNSS